MNNPALLTKEEENAEYRRKRDALAALPGSLHRIGKSYVLMANVGKFLDAKQHLAEAMPLWCEANQHLPEEKRAAPPELRTLIVAFIPVRRSRASVFQPYRVPYVPEIPLKDRLKKPSALRVADAADIAWVSGRRIGTDTTQSLIPWSSEAHVQRFLKGYCECCGFVVYPNLLHEMESR